MLYYERHVIAILFVVCLSSAWPQYRTDTPTNERAIEVKSRMVGDNERAVWPNEERQKPKSLSTPTNSPNNQRSNSPKSRSGRTQAQDGVKPSAETRAQHTSISAMGSRAHQSQPNQSLVMLPDAPRQPGRSGGSGRMTTSPQTPLAHNTTRLGEQEGRDLAVRRGNVSQEDSEEAATQDLATRGDGRFVPGSAKANQPHWGGTKPVGSGTRIKLPQQSDIVFPGPQQRDTVRFLPRVDGQRPHCATQGGTFCLDGEDYPRDYLNNILQNQKPVFRTYFITDKIPEENNITQRFDDTSDDTPMCASQEEVVFPKVAQNQDNEWLYIVNQGEFKQGVRIEKCGKEMESCAYSDGFPRSIRSFCKQKYIFRQMLSLSHQGMPSPNTFRLPSCCACHTAPSDAVSRMRIDLNNQSPAPRRSKRRNP